MKSIYFLTKFSILFVFCIPLLTSAQNNRFNTSIKTAIEVGIVDIELFGKGFLERIIFKVDSKRKFRSSFLELKLNTHSDFYNLDKRLGLAKIIGQINYLVYLDKSIISFSFLTDNNYLELFDNYNHKLFHLLTNSVYRYKYSKLNSIQISMQNSYSKLIYEEDGDLRINTIESSFLVDKNGGKLSFGVFLADLELNQKNNNINLVRFGIKTEFSYRNMYVLDVKMRVFKYFDYQFFNQQLKIMAGKYFTEKVSVFVLTNLIRTEIDTENDTYALLINRMENYNSASLKLGYDLSRKMLLYAKFLYEDQNILESDYIVASKQMIFGTQIKF